MVRRTFRMKGGGRKESEKRGEAGKREDEGLLGQEGKESTLGTGINKMKTAQKGRERRFWCSVNTYVGVGPSW